MTSDEGETYDLRRLRTGWLAEIGVIHTWLSTLGHTDSAAAVDTQHVLAVAEQLNDLVNSLGDVWDEVERHVRGEVPRKHVDQAVARYEERGNTAGPERGDGPAAGN